MCKWDLYLLWARKTPDNLELKDAGFHETYRHDNILVSKFQLTFLVSENEPKMSLPVSLISRQSPWRTSAAEKQYAGPGC